MFLQAETDFTKEVWRIVHILSFAAGNVELLVIIYNPCLLPWNTNILVQMMRLKKI
ncbi:MAG: hypothetical protein Q3M30_10960 [Candidatus Electrothrix sp. Rat3]|nr:hypothetical protein [Candidatus Electrothrix rattekaaiensis]